MSGYQTHALVGGVGGLVLVVITEQLRPELIPATVAGIGAIPTIPGGAGGALVIVASALLALVPDVDEPGSWMGRRVQAVFSLAGIVLGIALPLLAGLPWWTAVVGAAVGILIGGMAGWAFLRGLRTAAGGHRRFTHSLILAGGLAALAVGLWLAQLGLVALIPAAFAWGIVLHNLADVVTPSGVPLLYPLSSQKVRVLPEPLCRAGEPIIAVLAIVVAWVVLRFA